MSAPTAAKEQEEQQLKQPTKSMLKQPTKSMLEQLPVDRDGARDLLKDEGWMSQWSQCVDYLLRLADWTEAEMRAHFQKLTFKLSERQYLCFATDRKSHEPLDCTRPYAGITEAEALKRPDSWLTDPAVLDGTAARREICLKEAEAAGEMAECEPTTFTDS